MAALPASKVDWQGLIADYDLIRDKIEAVYPDFKDYNARIRHPGGFRLPLAPDRAGLAHEIRQGRVHPLRRTGGGPRADRRGCAEADDAAQP